MLIAIIATICVATGIGTGAYISKKRFDSNLADANNESIVPVDSDNSLSTEINRYERLKRNLIQVRKNVDELDIPTSEPLSHHDDAESALNKLSSFFEQHSRSLAGTEAFILSIIPISQTGEALCAFAKVAPDLLGSAFSSSVAALKDGATIPGIDCIHDCLCKFYEGMIHTSPKAISVALQHHSYMSALLKPVKNGLIEMSGLHDAANSLSESIHDMGDTLGSAAELSIDPTDLTDLDFSGHVPLVTVAISSFREFNLLMENKTNALVSLKNIGLDAAGAGGGGLVGAKAGALAGSFFGPVGTLIGGIIGGIGGAMGGRTITNNIKQRPLKRAIEDYESNASRMQIETNNKSRILLDKISSYTVNKRATFKNDKLLQEIPVVENEDTVVGIAVVIYQAIAEHIALMKAKADKIKNSFWYSESKYGLTIDGYNQRIENLERQLPAPQAIEENPNQALETLLALQIPSQKTPTVYQKRYMECTKELQEMNDKNNSSMLVWGYMVDGLYQKTMNEIADFANNQMNDFNQFVAKWKQTMASLEKRINVEKGRLGIK